MNPEKNDLKKHKNRDDVDCLLAEAKFNNKEILCEWNTDGEFEKLVAIRDKSEKYKGYDKIVVEGIEGTGYETDSAGGGIYKAWGEEIHFPQDWKIRLNEEQSSAKRGIAVFERIDDAGNVINDDIEYEGTEESNKIYVD